MNKAPAYDGTQSCLQAGPAALDAFAGRAGALTEEAERLCHSCPFLEPCRAYALSEDVHGVWGGWTGEQRRLERLRLGLGLSEPTPIGEELDLLVKQWWHLNSRTSTPRPRRREAAAA